MITLICGYPFLPTRHDTLTAISDGRGGVRTSTVNFTVTPNPDPDIPTIE